MQLDNSTALDIVLRSLFDAYKNGVPDVNKITDAMIREGMINSQADIINDHIAFRTLGVPNLGLASLEKIFLHYGYQKRDYYYFEQKKLNAYWYAPPSDQYPRIFLSELMVEELSQETQDIIQKYTASITVDPVDELDLDNAEEVAAFFHRPLWELPSIEDYQSLASESEYASWVIYNRYYLNHYTISIHELDKGYHTLEAFNDFVTSIGVKLNTSGGIIKTSKDGLLKQSSSVAKMVEATFSGGETMEISGSYVEFAERLALSDFSDVSADQLTRAQRRDGFESANADKIFESTYSEQTGR